MNIQNLEDNHLHLLAVREDDPKEYTKISVEFALDVLRELYYCEDVEEFQDAVFNRVDTLSRYLDEK